MADPKSAARHTEKTAAEFSGATREFAAQGTDFARNLADKTRATAQETARSAEEVYSTITGTTMDFHRQWIEMIRENTNATLDFAHQVLSAKSPSEFVELAAEHARKRFETFAEQAHQLAGNAQKMTTDLAAPMSAGMKNILNKSV